MQVILLDKVANLGGLGDEVKVRAGFGRNFLIPNGKAVIATPDNKAIFEGRRQELEQASSDALTAAQARATKLESATVEISHKAGDEGKLFGSVGTNDIAEALNAATGSDIKKNEIRMPDGALRAVGEYDIEVHLHADVNATAKVVGVAEA